MLRPMNRRLSPGAELTSQFPVVFPPVQRLARGCVIGEPLGLAVCGTVIEVAVVVESDVRKTWSSVRAWAAPQLWHAKSTYGGAVLQADVVRPQYGAASSAKEPQREPRAP